MRLYRRVCSENGKAKVRVLLDTHALIWALEDNTRLSTSARTILEDLSNEIWVSVASAIEISIKRALGKLDAPADLISAIDEAGFVGRDLTFEVAERMQQLPPHHRDPFDRLLVAHALHENVPILSCDELLGRYPVAVLW